MGFAVVVIGASLGGTDALGRLLAALPRDFRTPIAAVLHRSADSGEALIRLLQAATSLQVKEAEDKEPLEGGSVYLAPAGYHLLLERSGLALSVDEPVCWSRPSIDVLFESAADSWGPRAIGVLLTGANADGARGMARIKARGGVAVVQEPSESVCRSMPEAAMAAAAIDRVLPLTGIADLLAELCARPSR